MRRPLLVILAIGVLAGCGSTEPEPLPDAEPATPQRATLSWREIYGKPPDRLVFTVDSFDVTENGWRASIAFANETRSRLAIATGPGIRGRTFGVMLFPSGDLRELERLNRAGELPAVRTASSFTPPLPAELGSGEEWRGTIASRGALPAGGWVRVVFGAFVVRSDDPPDGLEEAVVWITDHAHRLRPPEGQPSTSVAKAGSFTSEAKSASPAAISR